MMGRMKTIMKLEDLTTVDQLAEFLSGTQAVVFSVISDKDDCYRWKRAFGRVSGQRLRVEGNPISNLKLALRSLVSNRTVEITGDSRGRFAVHELPEGEVVFQQQQMPNFTIKGIRVSAGEEARVRLVLDVGSQRIDGRVLDPVGYPLPVANVALLWEHVERGVRSSSRRAAVADANGVFSFSGVGPGMHSIVVSVPGYKTLWKDHDSMEQAEVVLQLETLAVN